MPADLLDMLNNTLSYGLDAELAGPIMRQAEMSGGGHERFLLREIHAQLENLESKVAKELRQNIIAAFETLLKYELNKHHVIIGKTQISTASPSQLEVSCSIAWFWEDDSSHQGCNSAKRLCIKTRALDQ